MLIVKRIHTKQGIYRLICVLEQKYRGFQPTELNSWLHSHVHYLYTSTYNNNIYNHIYIYVIKILECSIYTVGCWFFRIQNNLQVIIMDLDDPLEGGPCYWLYCKVVHRGSQIPKKPPLIRKVVGNDGNLPWLFFSESSWLFFFWGGAILLGRTIDISTSCCVVYIVGQPHLRVGGPWPVIRPHYLAEKSIIFRYVANDGDNVNVGVSKNGMVYYWVFRIAT
jgi:hypothetical protein